MYLFVIIIIRSIEGSMSNTLVYQDIHSENKVNKKKTITFMFPCQPRTTQNINCFYSVINLYFLTFNDMYKLYFEIKLKVFRPEAYYVGE